MRKHSDARRIRKAGFPHPQKRVPRALPALEWVEDASGSCARATAIGSRSLLVENHTGILSFTDSRVQLDTQSGPLCVTGSGLTLSDVRMGALIIRGSIRSVELPCRGGDASNEG